MKTSILLCCLIFTAVKTFAQYDPEKMLYIKKAEKYRKMKNTGTLLTVGGVILTVVGVSTLINSTTTTTVNGSGQNQTTSSGNAVGGAIAYVLGVACVGSGVPLWIVGAHAQKKYLRKLEAVTIGVNLNERNKGLTLRYRF
jgi:hypothetical protein